MKRRNVLGATVLIAGTALAPFMPTQHVAHARAMLTNCSGGGCDGLDPYQTANGKGVPCTNGMDSIAYAAIGYTNLHGGGSEFTRTGYVQLWWSPTCGTKWSVVAVDPAYSGPQSLSARTDASDGRSTLTASSTGMSTHSAQLYCPSPCTATAYGSVSFRSATAGPG